MTRFNKYSEPEPEKVKLGRKPLKFTEIKGEYKYNLDKIEFIS